MAYHHKEKMEWHIFNKVHQFASIKILIGSYNITVFAINVMIILHCK